MLVGFRRESPLTCFAGIERNSRARSAYGDGHLNNKLILVLTSMNNVHAVSRPAPAARAGIARSAIKSMKSSSQGGAAVAFNVAAVQ